MTTTNPHGMKCLTEEERGAVEAAWQTFQHELEPVAQLVGQADGVDCSELHDAFRRLATAFDAVEQTIMRAQQIRLLATTQSR